MSESKLINEIEFVSLDGGRKFNYVKLDEKSIEKLKLIFEENRNLILWIDTIGLHKYKKHFSETNLDILKKINVSRILLQGSDSLTNLDGIYSQTALIELDTTDFENYAFDFCFFKNLEKLSAFWSKEHRGFFSLTKLRNLSLWKYKSKNQDLKEFEEFKKLNYLKLIQSNVTNLHGLEKLESIEELVLAYNPKLEFERNSKFSFTQVVKLEIENCKKINLDFIKVFPNLKKLEINNQPDIISLKPLLDGLTKLEQLSIFGTKIKEVDNQYWLDYKNINEFKFQDMRHYKLKPKDFKR